MAGLAAMEEVRPHPTRHGKHSDHRDRLFPAQRCAAARTPGQVAGSHWGVENRLQWVLDTLLHAFINLKGRINTKSRLILTHFVTKWQQ
jgi:hypothetical protein